MANKELSFLGIKFDLNNIKAGIQKKDIEKLNNKAILSLFNSIDKADKNGNKNGVLDEQETQEFLDKLVQFAKDDDLSSKEAKSFLKSFGITDGEINILSDLLDVFITKSEKIKETTFDSKRNSVVIEYKEGYYEEILYNGRQAVKPKESVDTTLQPSLELNVPFLHMAERDGDFVIKENNEHDFSNDVEEFIQKNNIDKTTAKETYNETFNPPRKDGVIYFDKNGQEVLRVGYGMSFSNLSADVIDSIEYKQGDNWVKLEIWNGKRLSSVATLNEDRSKELSKTEYADGRTKTKQYNYDPNTNLTTCIKYDFISGKQTSSSEMDEKGRVIKVQHYDENEKVKLTEINEYIGNEKEPFNTKKFDKNNELIKPDAPKEEIVVSSMEEYSKRMRYGENYDLFVKLENDVNDESARNMLKAKIEDIKNKILNPDGEILSLVNDKDKAQVIKLMTQMLDKCEQLTNFEEIKQAITSFEAPPRVVLYPLMTQIHNSQPDGTIDQVNYQGYTGNCWFLSATGSVAEIAEGGKEYMNQFFVKDENGSIVDKDGNVTVVLNGGKNKYVISQQEREDYQQFSVGDPNMRTLEIAFDKYAKEYGINGEKNLNGGYPRFALEIYSGNKSIYTTRQEGKLGITLNGEFVELNEENADKLAEIPICIKDLTPEDLQNLAKLKNRMSMCCASYHYMEGHALFVKDIKENSVQVKEPNNTGNISTYSIDAFLEAYKWDEKTIFILPSKNK